ncbi:MAG: Gfo/Idh/MocA family oxidoreductase [Nitrososphaerota archaeon]|nr:Gfo/Idh/MocA family oxidoreductase [Nitrososphaerota archaeon]
MRVPRVKVGFVGVGRMGQSAHLRNYAALPGCEVVAIAELRPELAKAVASKYGVPRVYRTHMEMLASEELDAIVAPQQYLNHWALIPELLKAGLPLFVEKPLAGSVDAARKLTSELGRSRSWVMVGYHKRSDPAVVRMKEEVESWVKSAEAGSMTYVRITMPPGDWIAGGFDDLVRTQEEPPELEREPLPADMDGKTYKEFQSFINYYIHQVNLLRHLLGESYDVEYADQSMRLLVARSKSGVPATIEMRPYSTSLGWQESAFVSFDHGWIRADLPSPLARGVPGSVTIFRDFAGVPPYTLTPELPPIDAMRNQAANFIEAVDGKSRPRCEASEALEDLVVAKDYFRRLKTRNQVG